jgi:hypothetical protein
MSWVRLDDAILDNPKIIAAGPLGFALHVAAITWCARNLSDGFIPKRRVGQLLDLPSLQVSETTKVRVLHALTADDLAAEMARIGLWHDRGEQWEVHDYLVYNPSKATVLARRARERLKKAQQRQRDSVSPGVSPGDSRGNPRHPVPVPVPVPVPGSGSEQKKLAFARKEKTPPPRAKAKTPWPEDLVLTEALAAYATRQGLDARYEWGKFQAHALRDDVRHVDWLRAWEYWVRNAWEIAQRHT